MTCLHYGGGEVGWDVRWDVGWGLVQQSYRSWDVSWSTVPLCWSSSAIIGHNPDSIPGGEKNSVGISDFLY